MCYNISVGGYIMHGVYQIKNLINGKLYIGSSIDVDKRLKSHFSALDKGCHNNAYLQNAWNKYG